MISICLLLLTVSSSQAEIFYRQIGDPDDDNGLMVHVYNDGSPPILTNKRDGAQIFRVHQPPLNGDMSPRAMSFESARFPGFFLYATDDNKLMLKVPKTEDDKVSSTFRKHLKVQKNLYIFSVEGKQYDFMCNAKKPPYPLRIKVDDNSRFFADRCSFGFRGLTKAQADAKLKKETGVGLDGQPESVGILTDPKGSKLNIVASGPGSRPYLSKKLDGNEIWKLHLPPTIGTTEFPKKGLNIESFKYPGYFLMATKDLKKLVLEKPTDSDSKQRATFRENAKVRTKALIYLLEGHEYEFICNEKEKPWYLEIKTDDNSKFFADRCSFAFEKLTEKQARKKLEKEGSGDGGAPGK